jgi:hypothetical protein
MRVAAPLPPDAPAWKHEIANAIDARRMTMKEVSLALGFGETFVRDLLKREREPGAEKLKKLQVYLGLHDRQPDDLYSKEVVINVARRLQEAGLLPGIGDDNDGVVKAFLAVFDEERAKLGGATDPIDVLTQGRMNELRRPREPALSET